MPCDLTRAHAACVHRDYLVIEPGETALILGEQLRIEAAGMVTRDVDLDLASVRQHRLAAIAVAVVAGLRLAAKMKIHLGIERALGQSLLQRIEQSAPIKRSGGITACQKLIE